MRSVREPNTHEYPLSPDFVLDSSDAPEKGTEEYERMQKLPYAELVGCLNWLARCTRPDISLATSVLGGAVRHSLQDLAVAYSQRHWSALIGVLHYLHRTKHLGIHYSSCLPEGKRNTLVACCDTDYATCRDT